MQTYTDCLLKITGVDVNMKSTDTGLGVSGLKRALDIWRHCSVLARRRIQFGAACAVLLAIILLMVWNTVGLNEVLENSTMHYAEDVSYQMTQDISTHIESDLTELEQLADSIPRLSDASVEEFLERKAQRANFDSLVLLQSTAQSEWTQMPGVVAAFGGESTITYVQGQQLLFAVPVPQTEGVLTGVRSKENIQALIQPRSFSGKGLSCIVDNRGQVVISPTDLKPFLQLEDIFQSDKDSRTKEAILQMRDDLEQRQSGVFQFTAVDGSKLVMAYHALNVNDWILLSLIPADLITGESDGYVFRSYMIVTGIAAAFALLLVSLLRLHRANTARMMQIALTDPLTGGNNNSAFHIEFDQLAPEMEPGSYAIVMLNVKDFRLINENFGATAGDEMLKYIGQHLQRCMGPGEFFARGDADQFFLCLHESQPERIQRRLDALLKEIESFNQYTDIHYFLKLETGACLVEDPATDVTILQDRARIACKHQGEPGRCTFYDAALTQQQIMEQELNALFEKALEQDQFQVYLQPKVRLVDQTVGGAEALVRWFHPQRGRIGPGDFIPLFERNGNICKLDLYMFEQVCRLIHRWMNEGRPLIPISVNLSRAHFKNLNFLRDFSELKERYCIPDGLIEFELTESIFFNEQQRELVRDAVAQMHRLGFLCSLDDFGMGYSALGLLKELDADTIKLDRQFFLDIANPKAQRIITAFVKLAGQLGIEMVAEGIETQEQLEFLQRIGCDLVQGYLYSKPIPIVDFENWSQDFLPVIPEKGRRL